MKEFRSINKTNISKKKNGQLPHILPQEEFRKISQEYCDCVVIIKKERQRQNKTEKLSF